MDQEQEIEDLEFLTGDGDNDESQSVDDFIRALEEKEKDLHITSDTNLIEISEAFDDSNEIPDFLKQDIAASVKTRPATGVELSSAKDGNTVAKLESYIAVLKQTITNLEIERKDLLVASQRRAKDFENFKSRTEKERVESFQNQLGNLATLMLPALDNLHRALDFALEMPDAERAEVQQFLDGVVLVSQQVNEVLAGMGILPIATVGEEFDPHFHEAVATEESDDFPEGVISTEVLKGYRIGDRVIRHSMVKVAKSPGPPA